MLLLWTIIALPSILAAAAVSPFEEPPLDQPAWAQAGADSPQVSSVHSTNEGLGWSSYKLLNSQNDGRSLWSVLPDELSPAVSNKILRRKRSTGQEHPPTKRKRSQRAYGQVTRISPEMLSMLKRNRREHKRSVDNIDSPKGSEQEQFHSDNLDDVTNQKENSEMEENGENPKIQPVSFVQSDKKVLNGDTLLESSRLIATPDSYSIGENSETWDSSTHIRRRKSAQPTDSSLYWRDQQKNAPFVTSVRSSTLPVAPSFRTNEIPYDRRPPRIIYYADLPEIVHHGPGVDKVYTRESRMQDIPRAYTIIDADPDAVRGKSRYPLPDTRYNRIPAPYQPYDSYKRPSYEQDPYRGSYSSQKYDPYRQPDPPLTDPYRNPLPAPYPDPYRRPNAVVPEDPYRRPSAALPQDPYRRPNTLLADDPYRRPPPASSLPPVEPLKRPAPSGPIDELYRDYNPRQPAPWSVQVGTSVNVHDDGKMRGIPGRNFYVHSQNDIPRYPVRY